MKKVINKVIAMAATAIMAMGTITCVGASISDIDNTKLMHMDKNHQLIIMMTGDDQFFADENGSMEHHNIMFYDAASNTFSAHYGVTHYTYCK